MEQVAVIYNPVAGRGRALELAQRVKRGLQEAGAAVEVLATQAAGDGTLRAAALSPEVQRIFVVGGDGTLREVAGGVLESGGSAALAHIPLGNANVVARELGVPLNPDAAVDALLVGHAEAFDALQVNGQLVLAMVGVGYDAQLAAGMDRARSGVGKGWYRFHGDSLYGAVGTLCLLKPERRRFELIVNEQPVAGRFTGCIVSNMRTYAKGWAPNPNADPQDGLLNYQALKPGWLPSTALSLMAAARHKHLPASLAVSGSAASMRIRASQPFHWQADGDAMGLTSELHIEVRAKCLRLIVP
ncbi:MAG: diacylglycerol kinase (ATP) [Planctomycetota bacterium]|jgi:diacylglycerol kinase (ATP)